MTDTSAQMNVREEVDMPPGLLAPCERAWPASAAAERMLPECRKPPAPPSRFMDGKIAFFF